jgi:putative ABC transport system permease protein
LPLSMEEAVIQSDHERLTDPLFAWAVLVGRLPAATSRKQAETQLNTLWWNWRKNVLKAEEHHIPDKGGWLKTHLSLRSGARGVPVLEEMLGEPLKVLEGMALVVLLIACVNVANLLLVKAARKHAELAVRGALGASRWRIFQQVIAEGLLLGLIGAMAGLVLGWLSFRLLIHSIPATNYLRDLLDAPMDWKVMVFCIAAGVTTSVLFSVAPALLSMQVNLMRALHGQSGSVTGSGGWLCNLFVSAETALSLALLIGAAVLSWNLYQLRHIDPGFATSHVLTFRLDASALGKNDLQVKEEYETIQNEILREPGVRSVDYAMNGLLTGNTSGSDITVKGSPSTGNEPAPNRDEISPGFFSTMHIPLLSGREFSTQDTLSSPKVAIVDETFVKHYFGGDTRKALGQQFGFGSGNVKTDIQIVGVVPTIRSAKLEHVSDLPFIYLPYDQSYSANGKSSRSHPANFYLRTSGDPAALAGTLHSMLRRLDQELPMPDFEPMDEHVSSSIFETTLMAQLASVMGGLALALAAIGLYGVLAFAVAQRTREIGIRMALGAYKSSISVLVLRQVGMLVAGGLMAGLALVWAAFKMLRSKDVNLPGAPAWLYCVAGLSLILVMLAASYLPARRASRVDPMRALRAE